MAAPATSEVPADISDAAAFAAGLVTRTLKLLDRTITERENSPEPPSLKECESYVATIKRAADTLKSLARLTHRPERAERPTSTIPTRKSATPERPTTPSTSTTPKASDGLASEDILSILTSMESSLTGMLPKNDSSAPPRTPKPPQPAITRRYGESLSPR